MWEMQQARYVIGGLWTTGEEVEGMGGQRRLAEGGRQTEGKGGRRGGTQESEEGYVIGGLGIMRSCVEGGGGHGRTWRGGEAAERGMWGVGHGAWDVGGKRQGRRGYVIRGLGITREVAGRWREWEVSKGGWYVIEGLQITGEEVEGVGGQRNESAKEGEGRECKGSRSGGMEGRGDGVDNATSISE